MNIPDSECGARGDLDLVSAGIFADLGVVVSGSVKSSANVAERALWEVPASPTGWGGLGVADSPEGIPSRAVLGGIAPISTISVDEIKINITPPNARI